MVFLPNLGVNRRDRFRTGIPQYASAQSLDFLDLGQKFSFLNWKRHQVPIFKKTINGRALTRLSHFLKLRIHDVVVTVRCGLALISGIGLTRVWLRAAGIRLLVIH